MVGEEAKLIRKTETQIVRNVLDEHQFKRYNALEQPYWSWETFLLGLKKELFFKW